MTTAMPEAAPRADDRMLQQEMGFLHHLLLQQSQELVRLQRIVGIKENNPFMSKVVDEAAKRVLSYVSPDALLSNMPGHMYFFDRDNTIILCNDQQAKYFGYENRYQLMGRRLDDFKLSSSVAPNGSAFFWKR